MMDALKDWATRHPEKLAGMMADGGAWLTYAELDQAADRVARVLQDLGIAEGGTIALLHDNELCVLPLWWGARRAGVYYVPMGTKLRPAELMHIVRDCAPTLLIVTVGLESSAAELGAMLTVEGRSLPILSTGRPQLLPSLEDLVEAVDSPPRPSRLFGREMIYSSGTTGKPKGIRRDLLPIERARDLPELERRMRQCFKFDERTVYLSVAPLYHATGRFLNRTIETGGTVVIAPKFDPVAALAAMERHGVTHTQWVPTMFTRLLALPHEVRSGLDLSTHRVALHAAAPCPIAVKRAMIDWWGPIVDEYYGGSENAGVTFITAAEWLDHVGSVGRSITGAIHILAEDGSEEKLPNGEIGLIYFEGGLDFRYTANGAGGSERTSDGYTTYGDLGHLDDDGYLYISDRRTDLIISGGVNIYPKEIELVLEAHPAVREAAVIGVDDPEFGQQVTAVVCLAAGGGPGVELEATLIDFCRQHLSRIKAPRRIVFRDDMPRNDNGKLLKRELREQHGGRVPLP